MTLDKKEFSSSLFLLFVGLFLALLSMRLSIWSIYGPAEGFFPLVIAVLMIGLSLIILINSFFFGHPQPKEKTKEEKGQRRTILYRVSVYTVLMFVYGFLMEKVGFLVTSALFIIPIVKLVEQQSWKITILVGLGSIIISYVLFVYFLGVPLPKGFIWNW